MSLKLVMVVVVIQVVAASWTQVTGWCVVDIVQVVVVVSLMLVAVRVVVTVDVDMLECWGHRR